MATIAELFVQLGIKGADKTVVSINAVSSSIKETAAVSLEAKAAILGTMYALEQFFAKSGAAGTALQNFNTLTGISTQKLQEYQYAARQMGVSNDETTSTFKNLQSAMEKQLLGVSRVSTWSQLSAKLGGTLGVADVNKFAKDPALLMQKLQEYARIEQDVAKRNETLRGFGISDNMIAALSKGAFNQDAFAKAPKYSDREIGSLNAANIAWSNLSNTIEMAIGHLNAAHGQQLVKDFQILVNIGLKFADVLLKVAERTHFFEGLQAGFNFVIAAAKDVIDPIENIALAVSKAGGEFSSLSSKSTVLTSLSSIFKSLEDAAKTTLDLGAAIFKLLDTAKLLGTEFTAFQLIAKGIDLIFQGWAIIFRGIADTWSTIAEYIKAFNGVGFNKTPGTENTGAGIGATMSNLVSEGLREFLGTDKLGVGQPAPNAGQSPKLTLVPPPAPIGGNALTAAPKVESNIVKHGNTNQVTVNQSLNFAHEGKEAQRTAADVRRAAKDAVRQMKVNQVN